MKVSILTKSRLALRLGGFLMKLTASAVTLIYFFLVAVEKTDGEMSSAIVSISGTVAYSAITCAFYMTSITLNFAKVGFFKTLPLTKNDIIDTISLDSFFCAAFLAVTHSAVIAVFYRTALLPYFLCAHLAAFAIAIIIIPFCMNNKHMYNNSASFGDDDKNIKKSTGKVVTISLGFMAVSTAAMSFIITRGFKVCDPAADAFLLVSYAAVSLLIVGIIIAVCRRIETYFGN